MVASILLPLDRPVLPVRTLVRCCELFGIAEGTTRVALSRMVAAGELHVERGAYSLTGPMLARHDRQQAARRPVSKPWAGRWVGAVILAEGLPAADRQALRRGLGQCHLGELRSGVWIRPDNIEGWRDMVLMLSSPLVGHCQWVYLHLATDFDADADAEPDGGRASGDDGPSADRYSGDRRVVNRLWDLHTWSEQARFLVSALDETLPRLVGGDAGALAPLFPLAAATVRHITADPWLPEVLLPASWPGHDLRTRYDTYEEAYRRVLAAWLA